MLVRLGADEADLASSPREVGGVAADPTVFGRATEGHAGRIVSGALRLLGLREQAGMSTVTPRNFPDVLDRGWPLARPSGRRFDLRARAFPLDSFPSPDIA